MKLTDLTPSYCEHYLKHGDQVSYEACCPELFTHYRTFWGELDREPVRLGEAALAARRQHIYGCLPEICDRFALAEIDLSEIELILMVGQNTSNGHAFLEAGRVRAWLAVETYKTPLLAKVFVTHELAHACHYRLSDAFCFVDQDQMRDPMRQLLTEGIATFLSRELLGIDWETALWGDYLEGSKLEEWMTRCADNILDIASHFLTAMRSDHQTQMFLASDPDDIYKFRSGYYLGLAVVETMVTRMNIQPGQLLTLSRDEMELFAKDLLEKPHDLINGR